MNSWIDWAFSLLIETTNVGVGKLLIQLSFTPLTIDLVPRPVHYRGFCKHTHRCVYNILLPDDCGKSEKILEAASNFVKFFNNIFSEFSSHRVLCTVFMTIVIFLYLIYMFSLFFFLFLLLLIFIQLSFSITRFFFFLFLFLACLLFHHRTLPFTSLLSLSIIVCDSSFLYSISPFHPLHASFFDNRSFPSLGWPPAVAHLYNGHSDDFHWNSPNILLFGSITPPGTRTSGTSSGPVHIMDLFIGPTYSVNW